MGTAASKAYTEDGKNVSVNGKSAAFGGLGAGTLAYAGLSGSGDVGKVTTL